MVSRKPGIDDIRLALECVISAGTAASRMLAHARVLLLADAVLAPMTLPIKLRFSIHQLEPLLGIDAVAGF
jgi:hypothetical protein